MGSSNLASLLRSIDQNREAEKDQGGDDGTSLSSETLTRGGASFVADFPVPDGRRVGAVSGRAGLAADLGRPTSSSAAEIPEGGSRRSTRDAETQTENCLGICYGPLDSVMSQGWAITIADSAMEFLLVLAYTFDLEAFADSLIRAKQRGVRVEVGVDRRFRRGKTCKNMMSVLLRLRGHGIRMRDLCGGSLAIAYSEVGRSSNSGLRGQQHSKTVMSETTLLCGSCNFTAASRANLECGTVIQLSAHGKGEAQALVQRRLDGGEEMGTD